MGRKQVQAARRSGGAAAEKPGADGGGRRGGTEQKRKSGAAHEQKGAWGVQEVACMMFDEIPIDTLIVFRMLWGVIMMWECWTYMRYDYNKLVQYYLVPVVHFDYYMFEWVEPMSEPMMKGLVWVLMISAFCVTVGLFYRTASVVFFVGFVYLYMLDATLYLNHFYLVVIFLLILIFVPANRAVSVDALLDPSLRSDTMPRYVLWVLRFEQVLVYFYAAIAKCNIDWIRGQPIMTWMVSRWLGADEGSVMRTLPMDTAPFVFFIAWGGLVYDGVVGFMLVYPPTFYLGMVMSVFFHAMNKALFSIGIFPQVMLACLTLFWEPDWPRKFLNSIRLRSYERRSWKRRSRHTSFSTRERVVLGLICLFVLHQTLVPLRHYRYRWQGPHYVAWDDAAHRWSWRMKLRDKQCNIGMVAVDRTRNVSVDIDARSYLHGKQYRKTLPRPDLVIQFATWIADKIEEIGPRTGFPERPEIYAHVRCSLNSRPWQDFIRPTLDLARVDWRKEPWDFVVPLEPLSEEEKNRTFPWRWPWNGRWLYEWPSLVDEVIRLNAVTMAEKGQKLEVNVPGVLPYVDEAGHRRVM